MGRHNIVYVSNKLEALYSKVEDDRLTEGKKGILSAIKSMQTNVYDLREKEDDTAFVDAVTIIDSIFENHDKLRSDDQLENALGIIELFANIGSAILAAAGASYIEALLNIIATVLPTFSQGQGTIIKEELNEVRGDEILGQVCGTLDKMLDILIEMKGKALYNNGKLTNEEKVGINALNTVACDTLGNLKVQIERRIKIDNDEKESKRLASYIYFYCLISAQKHTCLFLRLILLKANNMEATFHGAYENLFKSIPKRDRNFLEFLSGLPKEKDWYMLYRHLHISLNAAKRSLISNYMKYVGCGVMEGKLCTIYSNRTKEYLYISESKRGYTWKDGDIDDSGLFRIIGDERNCLIFSVRYGGYLYKRVWVEPGVAANRRSAVFVTDTDASKQERWEINGHENSIIKNLSVSEPYLYVSYSWLTFYRREVDTSSFEKEDFWRIKYYDFETDELTHFK